MKCRRIQAHTNITGLTNVIDLLINYMTYFMHLFLEKNKIFQLLPI